MRIDDLALFQQIVVLVGHLAWEVTTILLFLLIRRSIGIITTALSSRIMDPRRSLSASYGNAKLGIVGGGLTATGKKLNDRNTSDAEFRLEIKEWLKKKVPA